MKMKTKTKYKIVDYSKIPGVCCPCGTARRGLYEVEDFPGTIHRTDIDKTAKPHFHKITTEIYYIISCEPDSKMQLDDETISLHEEMAIYIPPETVHCLSGKAKVFILALPKFDPDDEFVVEDLED
jgi:quercetin dioxygenase-like cupin family protein